MERQRAKTFFFGTLILVVLLAVAYYFFVMRKPEDGYRGIMVDATRGCIEWSM